MMKTFSKVFAAGIAGIAALLAASAPQAASLDYSFVNNHPNSVLLEFYSQDRSYVWPGNDQAYNLNDNGLHEFPLACNAGETICYGAWVDGDETEYWGVGKDDTQSCENCCAVCGDGTPPTVNLNP